MVFFLEIHKFNEVEPDKASDPDVITTGINAENRVGAEHSYTNIDNIRTAIFNNQHCGGMYGKTG